VSKYCSSLQVAQRSENFINPELFSYQTIDFSVIMGAGKRRKTSI
jgi:hypothetical protein